MSSSGKGEKQYVVATVGRSISARNPFGSCRRTSAIQWRKQPLNVGAHAQHNLWLENLRRDWVVQHARQVIQTDAHGVTIGIFKAPDGKIVEQ